MVVRNKAVVLRNGNSFDFAPMRDCEMCGLLEQLIVEINRRKEQQKNCNYFDIGHKDQNKLPIFTGDILKTPDCCYCTAIYCDGRAAIESPGSNAIDYEVEQFFNSCVVVANIKDCPDFYEKLVEEIEV